MQPFLVNSDIERLPHHRYCSCRASSVGAAHAEHDCSRAEIKEDFAAATSSRLEPISDHVQIGCPQPPIQLGETRCRRERHPEVGKHRAVGLGKLCTHLLDRSLRGRQPLERASRRRSRHRSRATGAVTETANGWVRHGQSEDDDGRRQDARTNPSHQHSLCRGRDDSAAAYL